MVIIKKFGWKFSAEGGIVMRRAYLSVCAGVSIFSAVLLSLWAIGLRTHVINLEQVSSSIREHTTDSIIGAALIYASVATVCLWQILKFDPSAAEDSKILADAERKLANRAPRLSEAARKLAVRVRRDLGSTGLADPLLEDAGQLSLHLRALKEPSRQGRR